MREVVEQLHALLDELAREDLVGLPLANDVVELDRAAARLDAERARRLRAFDTSREWSTEARTPAAFLAKRTRCTRRGAAHRVTVARQVDAMPIAAAAWAEGAISTAHLEVIAKTRRNAKADDAFAAFEPALVDVARTGTPGDVTDVARQWRDALDADRNRDGADTATITDEQREERRFDFSRSLDDMGFGSLTLDPVGAEIVETGLRLAYKALHAAADPRTPTQQRADALVEIFRFYLEHRGTQSSRANLPHIAVITDRVTVEGDAVGECRLASGARIAPETTRRLLCDADVQQLIVDADNIPLALSRSKRTFTDDQFRAMVARDAHCRGPDCTVGPEGCEAHHLEQWSPECGGGNTDLDNGALLCRHNCHAMLHEGGWTVTGDANGRLDFFDRDGNYVGSSEPAQPVEPILTKQGRERVRLETLARQRALALAA